MDQKRVKVESGSSEVKNEPSSGCTRLKLSCQQQEIVSTAVAPDLGFTVAVKRVTAAAGTGKTTTLEALAKRLQGLGHNVRYVTFSKTQTTDASIRMVSILGKSLRISTVDSCALQVLKANEPWADDTNLCDDHGLENIISTVCESRIETFLKTMPNQTVAEKSRKKKQFKQTKFFIRKTLTQAFLQKADIVIQSCYYPAILHHTGRSNIRPSPGVPTSEQEIRRFYIECAKMVWNEMQVQSDGSPTQVASYESIMKRVQIGKYKIECTALLVDESQDLNACQVEWLFAQACLYNTHVYFVGDAAQSIHSFRGAQSTYLANLRSTRTCEIENMSLTGSYRFGPQIGDMANTILCCKKISPQTTSDKPTWKPYILQGLGGPGRLRFSENICLSKSETEDGPVTVLGFANMDLLIFALELFEKAPSDRVLKVAINGKGDSSGLSKWREVKTELRHFYNVYKGLSHKLPYYPWEEEETVSWNQVLEAVESFELSRYNVHVGLIQRYEDQTMEKFTLFENNIVNQEYSCAEADVILSTIHAAKGMEWDRVQVLDYSLTDLARFKVEPATTYSPSSSRQASPQRGTRYVAQMQWQSYGDLYNLWYVAVTRAKKELSIPPKMCLLLEQLHRVGYVGSRLFDAPPSTLTSTPTSTMISMTPPPQGVSSSQVLAEDLLEEDFVIGGARRSPSEMQALFKCLYEPWSQTMVDMGSWVEDLMSYDESAAPFPVL